MGRSIGLDVRHDFCEVAIAEDGKINRGGRFEAKPEAVELFAQSLGSDDEVVLEAAGGSVEIARILKAPCTASGGRQRRRRARDGPCACEADRFDAITLARLLAAGMLDGD